MTPNRTLIHKTPNGYKWQTHAQNGSLISVSDLRVYIEVVAGHYLLL